MKLLLDTHVAIWAASQPELLSAKATSLIEPRENEVYVSIISLWEIAIKFSLGRNSNIPLDAKAAELPFQAVELRLLELRPSHIEQFQSLALSHRDPFDRMILAQAASEGLTLLTRNRVLQAYSKGVIAV